MSRTPWTEDIPVYAERFCRLLRSGLNRSEAAVTLKRAYPHALHEVHSQTILRRLREYFAEYGEPATGVGSGDITAVPPPLGELDLPPVISKGIEIQYEDGHVWCDCHIPLHNDKLMNLSLERARVDGIRRLYIPGDFMDMSWASKFVGWGSDGPSEIQREFDIAKRIIHSAMEVFEEIYLIPGNHDGTRFKNMSHGALGFENLMTMILGSDSWKDDRSLTIGERRWMVLKDSPHGDWRLTHPLQARKNPLSLASALALRYEMNVLTAHQHYLGAAMNATGGHIICDGGYMSHEHLMEYKMEVDSTHSAWCPGYVELIDGAPQLIFG